MYRVLVHEMTSSRGESEVVCSVDVALGRSVEILKIEAERDSVNMIATINSFSSAFGHLTVSSLGKADRH